ncbi:MAG: sulfatase-like hydrolase/transferase [Verrucomicrobiota bacterium]
MKKTSQFFSALCIGLVIFSTTALAEDRPNILWIVAEDTSPWMGCYGYSVNEGFTPVIDKMAADGVIFKRAFAAAPVCSPSRSGLIVGVNPIRFNAHEHRSGGSPLPEGWLSIPQLMLKAGYRVFNMGKLDYNFEHRLVDFYPENPAILNNKKGSVKNGTELTPWRKMSLDKPFFGQIQLTGGKQGSDIKKLSPEQLIDPASVTIPADYPQNEMYRNLVAEHHNQIRYDDSKIGVILKALEEDGLIDKTIVVYISDHGAPNFVRHKQQPTEAGLHVPFVMVGPAKWVPQGKVREDLVSLIDLSATSLAWAGIPIPDYIEGRDLFSQEFKPRSFVGATRDRCDFTIDRIRTVRTDRFRYTRNYMLDRVLLQPQYRDGSDFVQFLRSAYAEGNLAPHLAQIYFGERPAEELYDVVNDPAQIHNLVDSPDHQDILAKHRDILEKWMKIGDDGAEEETDKVLQKRGNKDKKFIGLNIQYEHLRKDSDGDGLSDLWETRNGRDPADGLLMHEFDCGAWQTEGWESEATTNLAGSLGFLEFELTNNSAKLQRGNLNLDAKKNQGSFAIYASSDQPVKVTLLANGAVVGETQIHSDDLKQYQIAASSEAWKGIVNKLELKLAGEKATSIKIDWMKIN